MPKGFLKNALKAVASPFVEFDETPTPTAASAPTAPMTAVRPAMPSTPSLSDAEIEKFEKHFDDLLQGANLPGPDYFEFAKVEDTLVQHIADDKTRIAAAFAGLLVQGCSKQILVDSAGKYIDVIEKDRKGFQDALQAKMQSEVGSRKAKLADTEKSIADSKAQIELLQKGIAQAQAGLKSEQDDIAEAEARINKSASTYTLACDAYVNKIKDDITRIQNNL